MTKRKSHSYALIGSCLGALVLSIQWPATSFALAACTTQPPPVCDIDSQFLGGRWDLSQITGEHGLAGLETNYPFPDEEEPLSEIYSVEGTLTTQMVGGPGQNYIDVACDGSVTGTGSERTTGTITKNPFDIPKVCSDPPSVMTWTVTIDRSYTISGNVTGVGQLDLDLDVHTASIDVSGNFAYGADCFHDNDPMPAIADFDLSGDVEEVRLSGGYDPAGYSWQPTLTPRGSRTWLDDILHRFETNYSNDSFDSTVDLVLAPPGNMQPQLMEYNQYFLHDAVTVTGSTSAIADPKTPLITSMELQEPDHYLLDIAHDTLITATIDWRGQPPGTVEFTYGATVETLAGADTVPWTFNAGEAGTSISAIATAGSENSLPYVVNTEKVPLPGWAGTLADWNAGAGIQYNAELHWPVSLATTRTLDTLSLFAGRWGIEANAASSFLANTNSLGSAVAGDMETSADFSFANKAFSFAMQGPNATTLACDALTTTGSATATVPAARWQKTITPLTLVPGLQSAACGLSGLLCKVIQSVGIKASASANITGSGTYTGEGAAIKWDSGSLGGNIAGKVNIKATLPPPMSSVAGVEVYGGGSGCIDIEVAPNPLITTLGGQLDAGASAHFFGLAASASEEWPFGDACGGGASVPSGQVRSATGWVPADGQLAMATSEASGKLTGIAVWSELPTGQARPSGDIHYRFWQDETWGPIVHLTKDAESDIAPTVEFDANGDVLIVYQRSQASLPTGIANLPVFANGYELHWARIDSTTRQPVAQGALTDNLSNDFGPRLRKDMDGNLHLFWQRANGIEIAGTATDPTSLVVAGWDSGTFSWNSESVFASGLQFVYGWSPATFDENHMLVGMIIDTDEDFSTADDRELFQITRVAGNWQPPTQVTDNQMADDSVLAGYETSGEAVLLWRSAAEVLELRGNLADNFATAFTSANPSLDDGIGLGFAHGLLASGPGGLVAVWPESIQLQQTTDLVGDTVTGWRDAITPFHDEHAQDIHSLMISADHAVTGYSTRSFNPGNNSLSQWIEPHFVRRPLNPGIFASGFDTGDILDWTGNAGNPGVSSAPGTFQAGAFGLAITPRGCNGDTDLILDTTTISGSYQACNTITARRALVNADTDLTSGLSIEFGQEFSVAEGVTLGVFVNRSIAQFAYVQDNSPTDEQTYHAQFHVDQNHLASALGTGDELDIFVGYSADGSLQFRLTLTPTGLVIAGRNNDGSYHTSSPIMLENTGWTSLALNFAAGAGNGLATASMDGGPVVGLTGLSNDQASIDAVRLGAVSGVLSQSSYPSFYLDTFSSWR